MDAVPPLSRFGAIGDVHQEDAALEAALAFFAAEGVQHVLCVGDVADGVGDLDRCCQLLREHRVATVRGNHERWLLAGSMRELDEALPVADLSEQARAFLSALPTTRSFRTAAGELLLCHGLADNDMASVRAGDFGYALECNDELAALRSEGRYRWVVNGHTHDAGLRSFDGLTIINAGTLHRAFEPCVVVVDLDAGWAREHVLVRDEVAGLPRREWQLA
jgi:putative phosphoesterase